jgi:hypothetical protein
MSALCYAAYTLCAAAVISTSGRLRSTRSAAPFGSSGSAGSIWQRTRRGSAFAAGGANVSHCLAIANALGNLGNVAADQGEYERASALYEESLTLRQELGDKWGPAW